MDAEKLKLAQFSIENRKKHRADILVALQREAADVLALAEKGDVIWSGKSAHRVTEYATQIAALDAEIKALGEMLTFLSA